MNKLDKIANLLMPIASKMSSQRHLLAIRDGFIVAMPLIIADSIFILLNSLVFSNATLNQYVNMSGLSELAQVVNNGTLGILAILIAFTTGYHLATWYIDNTDVDIKVVNGIHAGGTSIAIMFMMIPLVNEVIPVGATEAVKVGGVFPQALTSSSGLFIAMIAALIGTEMLVKFSKFKKLRIKMPDGVPPAVATSFNAMIPECLVIGISAIAIYLLKVLTNLSVPDVINTIIQAPLEGFMQSAPGIIFVEFISNLLWAFGLHGSNILAPITSPPLLAAIQENINAFSAGLEIPNIVTNPFVGIYSILGGGGCILPLIIAIFIASKRNQQRTMAKMGLVPSIFNIAEPIMFGLPVVMNPVYMIPVIIAPSINLVIAYIITALGWVSKTVVIAPWTIPPVISAWVATAGDLRATVLALALFILDIFIFLPFVIASNKVKE